MAIDLSAENTLILREVRRGRLKHALFDFDGTVSLLREGWQQVMGPFMVEMICGSPSPSPDIARRVAEYIDESTGIQTILQMERLAEMVEEHGLVPRECALDPQEYKRLYRERLMLRVDQRIGRLQHGEARPDEFRVPGALEFLEALRDRGLRLIIFSGTDQEDVRNEAELVGVAHLFDEITGSYGAYADYNKEKVLQELMGAHGLGGDEVLIVGDGPVEIRTGRDYGCITLGVASDERTGHGWDEEKRARLTQAGADILVPDFRHGDALVRYLMGE